LNVLTARIRLDFRSDEPIYGQIVRQIEGLVVDGTLKPGDQLPTVRELAIDLRINFSTVARAYRILDEKRLISTQRGRGTYIWEQPTEEMMQKLKQKTLEELAKRFLDESQNLGYSPEQAAEVLQQVIAAGGTADVAASNIDQEM